VAAADAQYRAEIAATAVSGTLPRPGAVDLFVDGRGQTTAGVATLMAERAGLGPLDADRVVESMVAERQRPFVLALDSLDEARGQAEPIARLLAELAGRGGRHGVRILVATRRGGPHHELVRALGPYARAIDLDSEQYFVVDELVEAIEQRLVDDPDAPPGYREDRQLARAVAVAVAERARPSFLVGWAAARQLVQRDRALDTRAAGWREGLPGSAQEAMAGELAPERFSSDHERRRALDLLSALAYARGAGVPLDRHELWRAIAGGVAERRYDQGDIEQLLTTWAGDLVDRTPGEDGASSFRLFHEELGTYLRGRQGDPEPVVERRISRALVDTVPMSDGHTDWSRASSYVRTYLASHAAAAATLDEYLGDPAFLVAADPPQLVTVLPAAKADATRTDRAAYRHVARFLPGATPSERAAYLEMAYHQLAAPERGRLYAELVPDRPWRTRWARWKPPSTEITINTVGRPSALATAAIAGRTVVISACRDGTVRVWDLAGGQPVGEPFTGHDGSVNAVAVGEREGRPVVVSGGSDGTVRVWDLASGQPVGEPFTVTTAR
jgi:hypothetical protein